MKMSMGLFFCIFLASSTEAATAAATDLALFHSHLLCLCPDPKVEQGASGFLHLLQTLPTFLPVTMQRHLPCCTQGFQASWFVPAVQGPRGVCADWCHCFWTASRFGFVWEGSNLFFGRRSDLSRDLKLYSLRADC